MQEAIRLSFETMRNNTGGPFGAVVVKDGKVIARRGREVPVRVFFKQFSSDIGDLGMANNDSVGLVKLHVLGICLSHGMLAFGGISLIEDSEEVGLGQLDGA